MNKDHNLDHSLAEDHDGRELYSADSKYGVEFKKQQIYEGWYLGGLLVLSLFLMVAGGLGALDFVIAYFSISEEAGLVARRFYFLGLGGLLGGTVYGAKWLYHAVAKGLWHEDRKLWRSLSPWTSLGTTIGIWALMDAGFFPPVASSSGSVSTMIGIGFVIGYLSDRFLAKMKDLTTVLFGQAERRVRGTQDGPDTRP